MKRLLYSLLVAFSILGSNAFSQINDLPVSANPASICSGQNSIVSTTGSQVGINYSLRNSLNVVIDGPYAGTGNDITFVTDPLTASETYNVYAEPLEHSLQFDGLNSVVSLTNDDRSISGIGVTISAWIRTTTSGSNQVILSKYNGTVGFLIALDMNGKVKFDGKSVNSATYKSSGPSTTSVNDGQWHRIVGTTDGGTWLIYVDGVVESSQAYFGSTGSVGSTAPFYLGSDMNFLLPYEGEMDEVAVWDVYAFNNTSILPAAFNGCQTGAVSTLRGLFHFDEGTTIAVDKSTTGIDGVISDAPAIPQGATPCATGASPIQMTQTATVSVVTLNDETISASTTSVCSGGTATITTGSSVSGAEYTLIDGLGTIVDGPVSGNGSGLSFSTGSISSTTTYSVEASVGLNQAFNGGLDLDGSNDYINLSDDPRGVSGAFTLACWVKSTQSSPNSKFLIADYDIVINGGYVLFMDANGKAKMDCKGAGNGTYISSGPSVTTVNDGQWHYVVGTGEIGSTVKIYVDGVLQNSSTAVSNGSIFGNFDPMLVGRYNNFYTDGEIDQIEVWNVALSGASILANMTNCLSGNETGLTGYFDLNEQAGIGITDKSATGINGVLTNMDPASDWVTGAPTNCSATIGCGLTMSQQLTINVDNVAPVADLSTLPDVTAQCQVTSLSAPTATDACSGSVTGTHNASFPITSNTTVTWTYDDGDGNTATQTQNVVLNDISAPIADIASLSDVSAQCSVTSLTAPTATDNCLGSITGTHNASFPITSTTAVTWTYNDGNGNTSTQMQNVVINDNTAPVPDLAALVDITAQCQVTSLTNPSATDNCSSVTVTNDAMLPISTNTTVTWTYQDVTGNSSTQTQNVIINDVTAPVADLTTLVDLTAQCQITSLTAPTATDNCVGTITGTHSVTLPITANTAVTWTYDDGDGNTSTQVQNVIINDITAPVPDAASLSDLTAACEITSLTPPTSTDNCQGTIVGTTTTASPILSSTAITWTYDDGNGNTSTQTQNVIINDNIAPVADVSTLADINEVCEVTSLTAPTATDNCQGIISGTHNATLPITSNTVVTWTYDDGNGNTSTQTQQVNITDATAPVADATTLSDIVETCEVITLTPPTATDNCIGSVTGTHTTTLPITTTTTITWTYTDGNGNSSTQDQEVIIDPVDAGVSLTGFTITADNSSADSYQWVDCNNGNAPISGETGQSFTATANGNYAVEVTVGSCTEISACETISTIGIHENELISVQIYPNPTNNMLSVSSEKEIQKISIYDITGSLVQEELLTSFSVEQLAMGVYTVKIQTNSGAALTKFIKN
ncbi:MAG: LamG-like jellyroll fold domain-containing protein [Crocinitomicaceae bacterium]